MRVSVLYTLLAAILLAALFTGLSVGTVHFTPHELYQAVLAGDSTPEGIVVWELRLPRVLLAALVGGALAMSGAALQGYTRNPLADAGLLGISSGAALGAVIVFYYFGGKNVLAWVPVGGLSGAFASLLIVVLLVGPTVNVATLILAGVAVSSMAGALTALALNMSPNPYAGMEVLFWLLGSVTDKSWREVWICLPFVIVGTGVILSARRGLVALSLGEQVAESLGFSLKRLMWLVILGCAMLVGAATAVAGSISFIGMVVPHLIRPLVKSDPGQLLLPSALGGAALLLWADIAVRVLPYGQELKLGVLTALIGAPFFLLLLLKLRKSYT